MNKKVICYKLDVSTEYSSRCQGKAKVFHPDGDWSNWSKLFSKLKLVTDNLLLGETILITMVATSHDPHMICTLYCTHSEILRYFITKGGDKAKSAPNLTAIFDHFNRVSQGGMLCVCIGRGNIDLPPSLPPTSDVLVLHVECGVPAPSG